MLLEELAYDLPESLISAYPAKDRASARLLVLDRRSGAITHSGFASLGEFLSPGDLLVLNDSKVIPARLEGRKESGGRATVLLVEPFDVAASGFGWRWWTPPRSPGWADASCLPGKSRRRCWEIWDRAGTACGSSRRSVSGRRWTNWGRRRCRTTSSGCAAWRRATGTATRLSTPPARVRWRLPPPDSISRGPCWTSWRRAAWTVCT